MLDRFASVENNINLPIPHSEIRIFLYQATVWQHEGIMQISPHLDTLFFLVMLGTACQNSL